VTLNEGYFRSLAGELHLGTRRGGGDLWLPRDAFSEHAHFVGPTGVGKTRALQHLAQQLIDADDCCVLVLDPHDGPPPYGGLYHALKDYCYANGHADRLLTLDVDEIDRHNLVVGFNPLRRGRSLAVRAALAAENLRAVSGITEPASAVQLLKWSFNTFLGLHVATLPFRDAQSVLDADDSTYREVFSHILRERYGSVASDWQRLVDDDRRSRGTQSVLDFECGSTKRRIDSYLNNEYLSLMLSTHRYAFDPAQAIAQKKVVLCNLSPRDLMTADDHRKMFGTQVLHAFCRSAMDRPDPEAVPCFVIADEFHQFLCPEVLEILNGGRKFGIHLILAHQFLSQLQDVAKQDWRYLDAVLTNPAVRVVFGGIQWADAERFALEMFNQDVDLEKIKREIWGTVQTSHVEWMDLRTEIGADTSGQGWTRGSVQARGGSRPLQGLGGEVETFTDAYNSATSGNSAAMTGESVARDVPVVLPDEPRQELRSVEYWTREDQLFLLARELKNQPKQHVAVYRRGGRTEYGRIADTDDPLLTIQDLWGPDYGRLQEAARLPSPCVAPLTLIEEEIRERDRAFRERFALPPAREEPPHPGLDPAEAWRAKTEQIRKARPTGRPRKSKATKRS
jgi:hypothetical protein